MSGSREPSATNTRTASCATSACRMTADYCNGLCDGDIDGCSHCAYCQETLGTAWSEGLSRFRGPEYERRVHHRLRAVRLSLGPYSFETIGACGSFPGARRSTTPSAPRGSSPASAMIWSTPTADNDLAFTSPWQDASSIDPLKLLDVAAIYDPRYVQDFLDALKTYMAASPSYRTRRISKTCGKPDRITATSSTLRSPRS